MQQIVRARREIISRAYVREDRRGRTEAEPAGDQGASTRRIQALFATAGSTVCRELDIEAAPEQIDALEGSAGRRPRPSRRSSTTSRTNASSSRARRAFVPPSSCRSASVEQFAALKDGHALFVSRSNGARGHPSGSSRSQPVNLQAATPAIEQYLLNERKRKLVVDDLHALRGAAKIEYVGEYAANKPPPLPSPPPDAPPLTSIAPPPASGVEAAPQIDVAPREAVPASMPTSDILDKGLKGMK
jgi:hypothetical protein